MVPLEKYKNLSQIHKEKNKLNKVQSDTKHQGAPQSTLSRAGLTVEAALAFPLFLFAMVTVLFFFRILQVSHITAGALAAAGSRISLEAVEEETMLKAVGYFQTELLKEAFPDAYLMGGRMGIRFDGSQVEGDYADLKIQYRCRLPVSVFGLKDIPIAQRVRMKKWTGYHKETEGLTNPEELIVYITPEGSVYHTTMDCTHLRLTIQTMGKPAAVGAGYTACRLCGEEPGLYTYYYVTAEGDRYHTRLSCSGLKRTVYMVRISEAGGRSACSRCGGM